MMDEVQGERAARIGRFRLMKSGHGDQEIGTWDPIIPATLPPARSLFAEQLRLGRLAFRVDGPGEHAALEAFDEAAPEILFVPAIRGGSPELVRFFNRHRGIDGPGVPLPAAAAAVGDRWEGRTGSVAEVMAELEAACGDCAVTVSPPGPGLAGFSTGRGHGMIGLRMPATGYPAHCWRFLDYAAVDAVGAAGGGSIHDTARG
jgi:hypothetical protein